METKAALAVLAGLSQESRLAIFRLLVEVGPDGLIAGEIATRVKIPPPTLSFHLKNMSHAQLIVAERQGTAIRYAANFEAMNGLVSYLTENCCGGGDTSACAPKVKSTVKGRRKVAN